MKIDLLDPVVSAAPGETTTCRVRVLNDTSGPSAYRLRVVGLDDHEFEYPLGSDALPSGMEASFDVDIAVPREFAVGRHALAVEVMSDRRGELPVLAGMTVEVASIQHVSMRINPSTIRGRRKARFAVELDNREPRAVDLKLGAQGQDLEVAFRRRKLRLNPGDVVIVPGTVRGPRRVSGGSINHVLTVVAESKSAPIYADAAFQQRPFLPGKFRGGMAMLALLGLWVGILGGGVYWYTHRDANKVETQSLTTAVQDVNGDGIPDEPLGSGAAPGQAGADGAAAGGPAAAAAAAAAAAKAAKPTSTVIGGTVKAAETGDDAGVTVSLTPAVLGGVEPTAAAAASLSRGGSIGQGISSDSKVWPARYGRDSSNGVSTERRTESVVTQQTDGKGAWAFADVLIPDNYMLTFSKPGFDTKSFIVTPTEDGKAVEMDVVLATASGSASGVINGPDGPIGGVDIVISDGKLTFTTKSSSEAGKVGSWSVTGLSTPNTYTLTATVRGFGTQVIQLPFTPGQQRGDIGISMVAGVGSIGGHITSATSPLGGATITVSSGDLTRSTTSLTEGDAGSFLLPQLTIPGSYTVAVTADGYMTQTRQLDLSGNVAGMDFNLVHTTATIVGLVTSDTSGNLAGVGITIRHDDLVFTSTTAAAPSAGTFRINDVPPGEYLVSFARYDHADTSQLITVAAGQVFDLGTIAMKFQARAALAQTGRLIVPIFDSGTTAINGATVQLLRISDGAIVRTATDEAGTQGSFAFENVPIGTYTVKVTRPGFRTAIRRVTVGLSERQLEVHMLQLGQVSGVIVNALNTTQQLKNYEIKIYRLRADGTRDGDALERITVLNTQAPDADGNVLWESKPSSLTEGTYEVEVSLPPPGFRVNPQIVQDGSPLMRFVVSPTDEGTIRLKDLKVDTFPGLAGTVSSPKLTGGSITFTPIKSANVTLQCGTGTPQTTVVVESVSAPGTFPFTFTPTAVQNATAITNMCSVTVVATVPPVAPATTPTVDPAYKPVSVSLASPLEPIAGSVSNQEINVAMAKIPTSIGGKLYWRDNGDTNPASRDHAINTVSVSTEGTVITDFGGSTGTPPAITTTTPIIGTNSAGGDWALVGQVFGDATYVFNAGQANPAFDIGKMMITINESTRSIVSLTTSTLSSVDNSPSIDVELRPVAGSISGTTAINSVQVPPAYSAVGVSTTPPTGVAAPTVNRPGAGAGYNFAAAAGTWTVTVTPPAHHVFAGYTKATSPANQVITKFVDPNTAVTGADFQLTELAQLSIDIVDSGGLGINVGGVKPTVTFTRVANPGAAGDPGASTLASQQPTFDSAGHALVQDLDVNTAPPTPPSTITSTTANYQVSIAMPGYDTQFASVQVVTAAGTLIPATDKTNTASIAVPVRPGDHATLRVMLKPFGSIVGSAIGELPLTLGGGTELLFPLGTVTAVRALFPDKTPVVPPAAPVAVAYNIDHTTFSFVGEPGYYSITVTHPDFAAATTVPTDASANRVAGVYLLTSGSGSVNSLTATPFRLPLATGFIQVNARDSANGPVANATVYVNNLNDLTGLGTVGRGTTDSTGGFNIGGLPAGGIYTIVMRGSLTGVTRYPVIVDVTIPRGSTDTARTTTLTAKLVEMDHTITGTIHGLNSRNKPLTLPAAQLTITRTYDGNGAGPGITNRARETQQTTIADPSVATPTFVFSNVPRGDNVLIFPAITGYATPVNSTISVANLVDAPGGDTIYRAANVPVDITLTVDGAYPVAQPVTDATVKLMTPDGAVTYTVGGAGHTGTTYSFPAIPPERNYRLTIDHPLYNTIPGTPLSSTVNIDVGGATTQTVPVTLTPISSQIRGSVVLQTTPTTAVPTDSSTTVKLLKGGALVATPNIVVPNLVTMTGTGQFVFTLSNLAAYPDSYSVLVERTGYTPVQIDNVSVTSLGTAILVNPVATPIALNKQAQVTVTVSPNSVPVTGGSALTATAAPASPSVTSTCDKTTGPTPVITCLFTGLDSGVSYTMTFAAAKYNSATATITPTVGGVTTDAVTLAQPTIVVSVTTDKDANDAKSAQVTLSLTGVIPPEQTLSHNGNSTDYVFNNLPVGATGTLTVSETGYRTQVTPVTVSASGLNVSIALRQLVTVTGVVLANGVAAGSAVVHATPTGGGAPVTVTATAGGAYTITGLDVGVWIISGYKVSATNGGADIGDTITITPTSQSTLTPTALTLLPRQIAVTGNVTAAAGGATVVATEVVTGASVTATAGSSGAYSVPVDVGTWRISAFLVGKGAAIATTTVGPFTDLAPVAYSGAATGPDLTLVPRTVTISGTIRKASDNTTVDGASVVARNTSSGASPATVSATSGSGGAYTFPNLDVGTWVISAEMDNVGVGVSTGQPVTALVPVGVQSNTTPFPIIGGSITGVNVSLAPRSVTAGGTVASGTATPGATVNATRANPPQTVTVTANSVGDYLLTLPNVGSWTISGYKNGVGAKTLASPVVVTSISDPVITGLNLDLVPRTVSVTGTVTRTSPTGNVGGATVTATSPDNPTLTAVTLSDGTYEFSSANGNALNTGVWTFSAFGNNVGTATGSTTVVVTDLSAATVSGPNFVLVARSISISGKVSGSSVNNTQVIATNTLSGAVVGPVSASSQGNYTITGVNVGSWEVSAYLSNVGAGTNPTDIVVTASSSSTVTSVNVALVARVVTVTGKVTAGSATGISGASVTATRTSPSFTVAAVTTAADGTYSIDVPNVGNWTISAVLNGTGAGSNATSVAFVTSTSPDPVIGADVTLTARNVTYNFTGLPNTGNNTTVIMNSVTSVVSNTTATFTQLENASRTWTASQSLYYTASGTAPIGDPTNGTNVPVTMVAIPTITGTITANGANLSGGAQVLLCAGPVSASCTTAAGTNIANVSGTSGSFTIPPNNALAVNGNYYLRAVVSGYDSSTPVLTLAADGTFSTSPIVLTQRTASYVFTTNSSSNSVTVTMGAVTGTTSSGVATLTVPETQAPTWTATGPGYYNTSGTATAGTQGSPTPVTVTLTAIPNINGVVKQGATPHIAAHVLLCLSANSLTCTVLGSGVIKDVDAATGTGVFDFGVVNSLTPNTAYIIKAVDSSTGQTPVSTSLSGATLSPASPIDVIIP